MVAKGKMTVLSPISTSSPMIANAPIETSFLILAEGETRACGWIPGSGR